MGLGGRLKKLQRTEMLKRRTVDADRLAGESMARSSVSRI
jgi:hypothetical protein